MSPVLFYGPVPLQARLPRPGPGPLGALLFSGILVGLIGVPTFGAVAVAPAAALASLGLGWAVIAQVVHARHRERLAARVGQVLGVPITTADLDRLDAVSRAAGHRPVAMPFERGGRTIVFETVLGPCGTMLSAHVA